MSIISVVHEIDDAISNYKKRNAILEKDMGWENGKVRDSRNYPEFVSRKEHIWEEYEAEAAGLRARLKREITAYHKGVEDNPVYMPHEVDFGTARIRFPGLDVSIPVSESFPLRQLGYVPTEEEEILTLRMYRLLHSLPVGKCVFYVYDPRGFGGNLGPLASLLGYPDVFPAGKAYGVGELGDLIKEVSSVVAHMKQQDFPAKHCANWTEYNTSIEKQKSSPQKLLPYRVVVLFGLPRGADQGSMEDLADLVRVGASCGIYCMFSTSEETADNGPFNMNGGVQTVIGSLKQMACLLDEAPEEGSLELHNLQLEPDHSLVTKTLRDPDTRAYVENYRNMLDNSKKNTVTLADLLTEDTLFQGSSADGLRIPMGVDEMGEICNLPIGDQPVHILIGGGTGSGKSNLIHDIILNTCWKYSPNEVELFLLDFKEGVEFNKYAVEGETLPQAALIAKYADVGYGITVLDHLLQIYQSRADKFKKAGKTNYREYRKAFPNEQFPRILLVIDEFQVLYQETTEIDHLVMDVGKLAKLGRSAGIHMLFATQSLKGLSDFTTAKDQFEGRLVCKCGLEDSGLFLSYSNSAAAEINIPKVIFNEQSGLPNGNRIFSAPEVEDGSQSAVIQRLRKACRQKRISEAMQRVFDGEQQPGLPERYSVENAFYLGDQVDYEENKFLLPLPKGKEENVLALSKKNASIFTAVFRAAGEIDTIDCIDYIGDGNHVPETVSLSGNKVESFLNFTEYYQRYQSEDDLEELKEKNHLIILDHASLAVDFGTDRTAKKGFEGWFPGFLKTFGSNSHLVGFYDNVRDFGGNCPREARIIFRHIIGYDLSPEDWESQILSGNMGDSRLGNRLSKIKRSDKRAIYVHEDRVITFKPFKMPG